MKRKTPRMSWTGGPLRTVIPCAYGRGTTPTDTRELIITHGFLIAWFVRHALDGPEARWLGLNAANCALTAIRYRAGRPPALISFNDTSHLPSELRWTGFPPELHI